MFSNISLLKQQRFKTIQRQTYLNQNANDYDQQETEQVDDFGGNIQQEQRDDYDLDYEQQQQQQQQEQDNGELNDAAPISYGKTQVKLTYLA